MYVQLQGMEYVEALLPGEVNRNAGMVLRDIKSEEMPLCATGLQTAQEMGGGVSTEQSDLSPSRSFITHSSSQNDAVSVIFGIIITSDLLHHIRKQLANSTPASLHPIL
jgi:hypothetical protein